LWINPDRIVNYEIRPKEKKATVQKYYAEGEWVNGLFVATALMSLYYTVEGEIVARDQKRLETTAGTILLTPESEKAAAAGYEAVSLDELAVGDEIAALVWNDPTINTISKWKIPTL